MDKPTPDNKRKFNNYMRYSGIGFQLVGSVVAGVLVGYGLDKWLNTSPYLLLVCTIVFLAAGFYAVFKELMKDNK